MGLEAAIAALGGARAAPQKGGPNAAEAVLRDLTDPDLGANDSPEQAAERDAAIAQAYRKARPGGGAITFESRAGDAGGRVIDLPRSEWSFEPFGGAGGGALDAAISALSGDAKAKDAKWVPDQAPERAPFERKTPTVGDLYKTGTVGVLDAAGTLVTGALGGIVGAAAGVAKGFFGGKYGTAEGAAEAARYAKEVAHSLTWEPKTEGGREILETAGTLAEQTGLSRLAGIGPAEGMMLGNALANLPKDALRHGTRLALTGGGAAPQAGAQAAPAAGRAAGQMGSVGAAGVAPKDAAQAIAAQAKTPELRAAIEKAAPKMSTTGLKAAERHIEADTLPVPVRLTAGQATGDPGLISVERNARAAKPQYAARFNEQNAQLVENLDAIRDRAAPDVFATSRPAINELAIDAYKAKDAALNKTISANYQKLKDANGGAFPMDAKTFAETAYKKLHADLKAEFVPAGIEKQLEGFKAGKPMTFEQFEAMRTNLANVMRSNADGNAKQAAALIRDALEELPMPAGAEHLKPLADAARASARERFALIAADPAYKAVVRGRASTENFLEKFALGPGASKEAVARMRANLAGDAAAQQAISASALRRLRDRAGVMGEGGNFSPHGYNRAMESLGPKLGVIFEPESKKLVEQLGRVATYVKEQPAGSFVNNSNTYVAALGDIAKSSAEGAANVAAHGIPIGTWIRRGSTFVKEQKDLARSLQTGAGIRLKDAR